MLDTLKDFPLSVGRGGTRATVALVVGAVILVAGAPLYFANLQNTELETRRNDILSSEVREAANAVAQFVTGRQRLVEAFAYDNQSLLAAYADDVEDEDLRARIDQRLRRWFPSYFTFTLADETGRDLVNGLEGFVGEACQVNIQAYIAQLRKNAPKASYQAVIHPQANNYHFDVMAPWRDGETPKGVFFVSFYPEVLQSLIKSYQSPGHHLALVHRERENLIEINADGARDSFGGRRDIRLTPEEVREIRATQDIPGSLWKLVGYGEPGLIAKQKADNWLSAAFVVLFVLIAGALSLWKILALDRQQARVLAQLRVSNANLAELADEQAALREAAEAGEKTKAQFLASMSHEIRTPLNAIIGLTDLTLKTELSAHQRGHMSRVARAGRSLLGLINDILDYSKIEAGKLQIEMIDFDLDEVLENVVTMVSTKAEESGTELIITVDRKIPVSLQGDPLRLGQVLVNLVGNAAKFTERGEIVVDVAHLSDVDGEWLQFSVRDTGIGMTGEQVNRLFKPFSQADQSTTRTHGGTGLGLSISHELVDAMGGSIGVESTLGEGSRFHFRIPFLSADGAGPRRAFDGIDPRAIRVLVVDDNQIIRKTLTEALSGLRFKVDAAASGPEAIAMYAAAPDTEPYSVVLMDWRMPEIDGVETIRRMQAEAGQDRMPTIVMVSAEDMESISSDLDALGVEHCVQKPINTSFLIDTMMAFFETGADRRPVRARLQAIKNDPHAAFSNARLLLVEDVELNRMVALGVLENAGFKVDVAENGLQVLEVLRREGASKYAAVLMDIEMPEMDGITATRKIREELGYSDLPVIAMTAHALAEERERCAEAGMNDHISKPFEAAELISTINRWIQLRGDGQKAVEQEAGRDDDAAPMAYDFPVVFDLEETVRRLMLPRETATKLFQKFLRDYAEFPAKLADQVSGNDLEEAVRMAHSLKGVASSLGLVMLGDIAAEVEGALENDASRFIPEMQGQLQTVHAATLTAITLELGAAEDPQPSV